MQEIHEQVSLAPLTTFQIGGTARYFVDARSENDIREAIAWAKEKKIKFAILSGGSNVLVPDDGLDGLVIHMVGNLYGSEDGALDAWAGSNFLFLIQTLGAQGFGGWEKLAGIPGTIGGAVRGNAGAFGPEIKDFVRTVRAFNTETGETREFVNAECVFSYRHSFFKDHPEWIITRACIKLAKIAPEESAKLAEETIAEREKRHLQNVKAAGSFFMNPRAPQHIIDMFEKEKGITSREGRVPAGWLIEKAGMKGATVGGAIASLQHPNYIVNQGSASSEDVRQLADKVRMAVKEQFGVELHEEAAIF
jgi:UDP-N-acetylmuramate dehydrogenase